MINRPLTKGSNIANAAAHIVRGRTKILNSVSDANLIASDSNDSAYGPNNNYEDGKKPFHYNYRGNIYYYLLMESNPYFRVLKIY